MKRYLALLIERFYLDNQLRINENYPGIKLALLIETFLDSHLELNEFFEHISVGRPLEYISGKKFFYNHTFWMKEGVFSPRFETEILVEAALNFINHKSKNCLKLSIAEFGVGSGAILLSILANNKKESLEITALGVDNNPLAISLSKMNYFKLKQCLSSNINARFELVDFFNLNLCPNKFDLIVSNPPYISTVHRDSVHKQVLTYDLNNALFVDENKYQKYFKKLLEKIFSHLSNGGLFIMEGHERKLENVFALAKKIGFTELIIKKDYLLNDRFLIGKKEE